LGALYCIRETERGRALVLKERGAAKGAILARYSGEQLNVRTLSKELIRTHMLRIIGTDVILDGLPLAQRLVRQRGGEWLPADPADVSLGYASLANSAPALQANARMIFLPDDTIQGCRPDGYDAAAAPSRLPRCRAEVLPRAAYLVATRALQPLEEILWPYKYVAAVSLAYVSLTPSQV
jgi:hypothetical protein